MKITCPYCFEEFNDDDVLFRAETFFFEEELEDPEDIEECYSGEEKRKAIENYRLKSRFIVGASEKYTDYWKEFNGTTETTRKRSGVRSSSQNIENYQKPIIDPKDPTCVRFNNRDNTGVRKDSDNFLTSVEDVFGNYTDNRVCPFCHNPLPVSYGKFPIKFISVIGVTNSGKTVYLSSLMDNMVEYAAKVGMTPLTSDSVNFFLEANRIAKGQALPQGTATMSLCQPLCYHLQYYHSKRRERETSTFVIYDIAGENCISMSAVKKYGKFILHSDGFIILEDPNQFKGINRNAGQNMTDSVLKTIDNLFVGKDYCQIPLAMCISKSDLLINTYFSKELSSMLLENVRSAEGFGGFNAADHNRISRMLDEFYFSQDIGSRTALKNNFGCFSYFAVSALNCKLETSDKPSEKGGKSIILAENPHPLRIEEPLYWLFYQFGFISSDTEVFEHAIAGEIHRLNTILERKEKERSEIRESIFTRRQIAMLEEDIDQLKASIDRLTNSILHL
jgi:GTPase SAR1 family protein